ncbi:hypothetical protein A2631_00465 [Candidatus Daviesbacteria bacterium RIFCSPHIGHO2_01_FULL_44_29]|uniref:S-adenosylmethionine-dependent methyltransferase domain-containing protein n=1 Tax=Candidatus Daviesbacteria bacterium RIFCSPHIGHO2_02_FULL_43_12 TaxID=1797776 RepID=A0A1F5KHN3_9BACT|nr:MAG: hypothetical protein A2631_00465 [Candidatus Daviesbacteria bacterium RIFCSPHIGHO2_01_FULL_44_29]OGE40398.1 MAG: hypothetical protein A3D25_00030 [Candidatus Daviesbacteria bacterium RIFCSPHIGHO2_02_FULL_43_12]OGE41016.1 MAG: hypothetical protein A3E86_02120 [Candidatus Daviesbacteria bacterium RIFCSPHIGHO2_12_FULL_47_45]OGE69722.1 MAG: hypothetical protein A3B55_02010 [Candidatus Daviesbacteria bacterium RIFCSPLOWO2_01_FULL_43_15]
MIIVTPSDFPDYELLDSGNGYRLERYGIYIISRPDPDVIWSPSLPESEWLKAQATFKKVGTGGKWVIQGKLPEKWLLKWKNLSFWIKLSPFKHTGVFPEQAVQWEWMTQKIHDSRNMIQDHESKIMNPESAAKVLNLFGYTGAATLACAAAGAEVTHVDASYPAIGWARENQRASGLETTSIRWIQDDCLKFVEREIRRGVKYDGIIMDPPSFGHGPDGQVWKFNENFPELLRACRQLLTEKPLFVVVNAYAISSSSLMLENIFKEVFADLGGSPRFAGEAGVIESGELALEEKSSGKLLSTGIFARWSK